MSFIPTLSSSSLVYAVITRVGKEFITSNDKEFRPSCFYLADDEVNYQLLNPDNIDQDDPDILALPIPEPSTNENSELINKIWVDNTFLNQRFSGQAPTKSQRIVLSSEQGDIITLYSDDTGHRIQGWAATMNDINRPYVADYYRFVFTTKYDFLAINFINPALTDLTNKNYTVVQNNTEYIFQAVNNDGSGKYKATNTGSPAVVFSVSLIETPQLFNELQKAENREKLFIPNFLTVTQIDQARAEISDIQSASIDLQIYNVLS